MMRAAHPAVADSRDWREEEESSLHKPLEVAAGRAGSAERGSDLLDTGVQSVIEVDERAVWPLCTPTPAQ